MSKQQLSVIPALLRHGTVTYKKYVYVPVLFYDLVYSVDLFHILM
jgi:hypothetical protein